MSDMDYPDGAHWRTALDCGHLPTTPTHFHSTGVPITPGYATDEEGNRACYDCAYAGEVAHVADPNVTVFGGYVELSLQHGYAIPTWAGGRLALASLVSTDSRGFHYWRATTPDGRHWHGKNKGVGLAVTLRLSKSKD